ncbi:hypothetical protein WJX84_004630 [Apatococcus fuscideae]|uniref:Phospholipid/glycerol acyltransferase domain-containing protein n=1 Tax=Apatococcus fuscideae TaxID=2026836 RepID=A0AAW1SE19_9CHLO
MAEDPTQAFMAGEHSNSSSVSAHPVPVVASSSAAQPSPEAPRAPVVVTAEEVQAMKESSPYLDTSYPMTAYEWFKLVLLLPWVIVKLPIALIGFILVWSITKLIILGSPINEPLSPTRSRIMRPFLSFWADILIRIGFSFWRLPIRGREHIKAAEDARAIIAFNHVSYMDPYVMVKVFAPCGLAKIGVVKLPFLGDFARALQFLFVQRKGTEDKANKLAIHGSSTQRMAERAADPRYPLFMVAPEATTKSMACLLKFSSGAFAAHRPILPVLLHYRAKYFHPGWGSITSPLFHMLRMLCQFSNSLEVEILPVYVPNSKEKADPKLYAENVRVLMAKRLGVPLADAGILDHIRLKHAGLFVDSSGG